MTATQLELDPCARKSRHDRQSAAAFRSGEKVTDCGVILDLIKRNPEGLTIDDCSRILERSPNSISGRGSCNCER